MDFPAIQHLAWPIASLIGLLILRPLLSQIISQIKDLSVAVSGLKEIKFVDLHDGFEKLKDQTSVMKTEFDSLKNLLENLSPQIIKLNEVIEVKTTAENEISKDEEISDAEQPSSENSKLKKDNAVLKEIKLAWSKFSEKFSTEFSEKGIIVDRRAIGSTAEYYADERRSRSFLHKDLAAEIKELHSLVKAFGRRNNPLSDEEGKDALAKIEKLSIKFKVSAK